MIDTVAAASAYDVCGSGRVLLCFCREEDIAHIRKPLDKLSDAVHIIRVEPSVEAAVELQLARYPVFILYADGAEQFNMLGAEKLMETLRVHLR